MKTIAAAVSTAVLLLVGCGGDDTGTVSSSPNRSPSDSATTESSDGVAIDIAVKNGKVTPQGDRVEVKVGQKVTLRVTSDAHDTIHVHSEPEQEFEIGKGKVEKSFTIDTPGQIAVEAHHLGVTIVQLVVRP